MRILMVCLGNICRSPLAEGILRRQIQAAGLDWTVDSAGTLNYHAGSPPHPDSQKAAKANGIDISAQRARQIVPEDVDRFDLIFALATDVLVGIEKILGDRFNPAQVRLLLNELHPGQNENVPDPYYGTEADFHHTFTLLDQVCAALIQNHLKKA
ncbi:MAG: low molecular weight phosphotyrosine protein phosphatase [Bacteroidetes bacterium]|nr:low molecular weight phosphotyrosine protein phosphatase [Bacteroidota bacterium]